MSRLPQFFDDVHLADQARGDIAVLIPCYEEVAAIGLVGRQLGNLAERPRMAVQ